MQDVLGDSHLSPLLKASWQAAVLILLVLGLQRVFGRRLSPGWRYGLWLLVVIRLALPWTVPSPISLFNFMNRISTPIAGARATPASRVSPAPVGKEDSSGEGDEVKPAAAAPRFGWVVSWPLMLWLAGAGSLSTYLAISHCRIARRVTAQRPLVDAPLMNLLEDCKQLIGVRAPVTLVESAEVGSPSLFGFVRPRLLLPVGLAGSFSLEELRCVFLHELAHIKRQDILTGWVMTFLQILHWFNPLVWLAFHRMRVDRELACDALALSYAGEPANQRYGRTIIKLLESFGCSAWAPSLAGIVEYKNQMKERISMIARFKKAKGRPALAASLFAAVGLATLTDAQPGGKPPAQKDLIGTWVLAGKPGEVSETPASGGRLKFITGTHWAITQADPKTGVTIFHHGGTYALKGSEYLETAEYANQNTADLIGHTFKFTIKIEGDTLTQVGIGNPWTEVWKRLTNSTGGATMLDPANGLSVGSNLSAQPAPDPQAPPSIVATSPAIGATDVDPAITKITVTFDRDMGAGFSWTGGGPEHPVPPEGAKAHWSDARTCAYPVKLEAGHYYRVGINSKSY